VIKTNDHLMDATRYLIMSGLALMQTAPAPEFGPPPTRTIRGNSWMM
jgi:hypothetical protein